MFFKKNMELMNFILGGVSECIREYVIIAPCWSPVSVGIENCSLISKTSCEVWDCSLDNEKFTYIVSGVGAGNCADIVMALGNTECKHVLFIGSAGALDSGINIGDIAIPNGVISAEGATRYLGICLSEDVFGTVYYADRNLHDKLLVCARTVVSNMDIRCHDGIGISVESIYSQYRHLQEICERDCVFIDMEASACLAASNVTNIECAVIFCISDNTTQNEPLYLVSNEKTSFRKRIRREVMPALIEKYLKGETYENK